MLIASATNSNNNARFQINESKEEVKNGGNVGQKLNWIELLFLPYNEEYFHAGC